MEQIKALNVAIVGGGPGCKAIIDMIFSQKLSQLQINLIGIACTNPESVGYRYAQEKGIYTTEDYRNLYKLKDLNMIIELTGRDEVANEISKTKPEHVRLMDHVAAHLLWSVFRVEAESIAALKQAEEKYKTVIESSLTGIFIHQDGKYVFVNDKFAEMHGYTTEELLGKEFLTLIYPDEREALANVASMRLNREAVPQRYEVRRLGKGGRTFWCEMMATRIEHGGRPAIMGNIIDISERKQAEKALKDSEAQKQALLDASVDCIVLVDTAMRIVWANKTTAAIVNKNPEDLIGHTCHKFFQNSDVPCPGCPCKKALKTGNIEHTTMYQPAMDTVGESYWEDYGVPIKDESGQALGVIEICRNVTDKVKAEKALRESEEKLSGIVESVTDSMIMVDEQLNIVWINDVATGLFGPNLIGEKCYRAYHGRDEVCERCIVKQSFQDGKLHEFETEITGPDGNKRYFWCAASVAARDEDGRPKAVVEFLRDITERKRVEEELQESFRRLQVEHDQCVIYARALNEEVKKRKRAVAALHERKEALKKQARNLEEMNTVLKVLLERREIDKAELEEKVLTNVKELILPYVETLKNTRLDTKQLAYASVIELHLNEIVSPFLRKLSSKYLNLTPKEIQVAGLVKEGKTTKDIAGLLNTSVRAIEFHRHNIRGKLGLKNKRANLTSYLSSLQ